jgi:hypothetical protein
VLHIEDGALGTGTLCILGEGALGTFGEALGTFGDGALGTFGEGALAMFWGKLGAGMLGWETLGSVGTGGGFCSQTLQVGVD